MANPFFKPAAAQPQATPAASGPIGRIASAVQTASRVMRTMRDPSEAINAALNSQAFAGYTGPRDAQSLLRYGCGYSTRETASLLELSFAAAQKLLQRAKAALRQELEKEGLTV